MSDYTSTFTEQDGVDDVEAADFSVEFDAIQTAIASKYDSDDLLDEDDMATDSASKFPSQQSVKAYVDARILTTESSVTVTSGGTTKELSTTIPAWAKRVYISISDVSVSAASYIGIQLGDSGGFETSNYIFNIAALTNASVTEVDSVAASSCYIVDSAGASDTYGGEIVLSKRGSGNKWIITGQLGGTDSNVYVFTGEKTTSAAMDRIRLVLSTGTFDGSGVAYVSYSGGA